MPSPRSSELWRGIISSAIATALSLGVGALLMVAVGVNPLAAYVTMFRGSFESAYTVAEMLIRMTPMLLSALAFVLAFRCGLFNIGAEGQIYMGALVATVVGLYAPQHWPMAAMLPLVAIAGFTGGAAWAGIAGVLKARYRVHEIVTTIMMNYIAIFLVKYMVEGPLQEPSGGFPQTSVIADGAQLPLILPPTPLHAGLLIALAAPIVVWFLLLKTTLGFRIRVVGTNAWAARVAGMSIERTYVLAMTLSGGLAGLAGFVEISGVQHRLLEGFSPGYGFDGIAIGLLARGYVLAVAPAAMLFAILAVGANALQRTYGVPAPLVTLIQGLVILFVVYGDHARTIVHWVWQQTAARSYKVRVIR